MEKVVGRRRVPEVTTPDRAFDWQEAAASLRGTPGVCRRGVFRFDSFDEADAWLTKEMAAQSHGHRRGKTSAE